MWRAPPVSSWIWSELALASQPAGIVTRLIGPRRVIETVWPAISRVSAAILASYFHAAQPTCTIDRWARVSRSKPRPRMAIAAMTHSSQRAPGAAASVRSRHRTPARNPVYASASAAVGRGTAPATITVPAAQHHALNAHVQRRPWRTRNVRLPNNASPRTSWKYFRMIQPMNPVYSPASSSRTPGRADDVAAKDADQIRHGDIASRQRERGERAAVGQPDRPQRIAGAHREPGGGRSGRWPVQCGAGAERHGGGRAAGDREDVPMDRSEPGTGVIKSGPLPAVARLARSRTGPPTHLRASRYHLGG
jgi:hypothetical protein